MLISRIAHFARESIIFEEHIIFFYIRAQINNHQVQVKSELRKYCVVDDASLLYSPKQWGNNIEFRKVIEFRK